MDDWKARMEERKKRMAAAEEKLRAAGIKLFVGGCGCCSSPWVSLELNGELLLDDEQDCNLDSFPKEEKADD